MSLSSFLFGTMNIISSSLMVPVLIILAILVLSTLMQLGEFLSEYTKRHRNWNSLETNCKKIQDDLQNTDFSGASRTLEGVKQNYMVTSFAREAAKYLEGKQISAIGKLSQEYELKMAKRLELTKIVSTIGPMLGLMATLIPLGPCLLYLTQGDIQSLAEHLRIAFAATVVGLFAATFGYVFTQIRKRWYWEDMSDIDYILDTIEEKTLG